ncbi:hypothetical protein AVEN_85677-1 [Araneus ventricosus]|uniref:Uncharacterized protein n=1 Tax=Araneus ventricosus TaxID=182803 RepID=A0A4Y2QQY5_ARAVE|nr:hypothetical protein AVEN_85677-1 [Araneus ventricosus]
MLRQSGAPTNRKKIQIIQNKILSIITDAPWYIRNDVIHSDLHIETVDGFITHLQVNSSTVLLTNSNDIIACQTLFTNNSGKHKFPYSTTKWTLLLKPP